MQCASLHQDTALRGLWLRGQDGIEANLAEKDLYKKKEDERNEELQLKERERIATGVLRPGSDKGKGKDFEAIMNAAPKGGGGKGKLGMIIMVAAAASKGGWGKGKG